MCGWQYEGSDVEVTLDKIHAAQREAHHTAEAEAAKCGCILFFLFCLCSVHGLNLPVIVCLMGLIGFFVVDLA